MGRKSKLGCALAAAVAAVTLLAQQDQQPLIDVPLPAKSGPLRKAQLLLREGKTAEARQDLEQQRKARPDDADLLYQIARSYLLDFYRIQDPASAAFRWASRWNR